jgi:uncharacterized protein
VRNPECQNELQRKQLFSEMLNGYEISALVLVASIASGFIGAASGLGGAVLVIPTLAVTLGVDLRYAIGAGLVAALTTSSIALLVHTRHGLDNFQAGAPFELAGAAGALTGALAAAQVPVPFLSAFLGLVVLQAAVYIGRQKPLREFSARVEAPAVATSGLLAALYGTGVLSGLLGVGGGSLYSSLLRRDSRTPHTQSGLVVNALTAVSAAISASIYLSRGYIHPLLAAPVLLGALTGALLGIRHSAARFFTACQPLCTICLAAFGIQLILNAWEAFL